MLNRFPSPGKVLCLVVAVLAIPLFTAEQAEAQQKTNEFTGTTASPPSNADIPALVHQLETNGRHQAIRALGELGTPEAQALLLEIALGHRGAGNQEWAARCYVRSSCEKEEARQLLQATNAQVVAVGLVTLAREKTPIDDRLFAELLRLLQSRSGYVRQCCASLIISAPTHPRRREMTQAIVKSINTVATIEHAGRPLHYATAPWTEYTEAGATYCDLIRALATAKGINVPDLVSATPQASGVARDCVLIARGWRGDASVRPEAYRIAREADHPNIRAAALNVFSFIGTTEDLPFLENVMATDPYRVELTDYQRSSMGRHLPAHSVVPRVVYPNREHAKWLIHRIRFQAKQKE